MTTFRARLPYAEAAKALLRETLFDAAGELLRDKGWSDQIGRASCRERVS
jgi:hypothetical protein